MDCNHESLNNDGFLKKYTYQVLLQNVSDISQFNCVNINLTGLHELSLYTEKPEKILKIDLRINKIKVIPFNVLHNLTNIESINLASNLIEQIDYDLFNRNKKMKFIYLQNNRITHMGVQLHTLKNLARVNLTSNYLRYFRIEMYGRAFNTTTNVIIEITSNRFNCRCDALWMIETLRIANGAGFKYILNNENECGEYAQSFSLPTIHLACILNTTFCKSTEQVAKVNAMKSHCTSTGEPHTYIYIYIYI